MLNLSRFLPSLLASALISLSLSTCLAIAAPPVRIAVIPGNGSGMEQDAVDRISNDLQNNPDVALSTVNPDWFVQCNIVDHTDTAGGSVRVNGTIVIKTTDGQVLNTVSMQTNKQDFSLQPGMPVNKRLFDNAAREVLQGIVERVRQPLATAIDIEIQARDRIIQAQRLAADDKYLDAIDLLRQISPDSPHFQGARQLISVFKMEQSALEAFNEAQALAKQSKFRPAITALQSIDQHSKRFSAAKQLIAKYKARLSGPAKKLAPIKPSASTKAIDSTSAQLKALEAQKRALEAQKKAVEAQEAALKSKAR